MYCPKCGNVVEENEKNCTKCGFSFNINNQIQQNFSAPQPNNNVVSNVQPTSTTNVVSNVQPTSTTNVVSNVQPTSTTNVVSNVQPTSTTNVVSNVVPNTTIVKPIEDNNKKVIYGIGIGLAILIIIILLFGIMGNNHYYFSNNDYIESTKTTNKESRKRGKYSTIIVTDNTYEGVSIKNASDAYDLIKKDSVSQKDSCPNEIKQLENEIINKYNIAAVNLCEMDLDFAQELVNVFEKVYSEYPEIRSYLTNVSLKNVPASEGYIAAFMPIFEFATSNKTGGYPMIIKTQIFLNTSYFLNRARLESSVTSASDSGHFPPNSTAYSPLAHELGHYISFIALMKNYNLDSVLLLDEDNYDTIYKISEDFGKGNFSLEIINEAYNNYKKDTNTNLALDEWRGTISNYALAKDNSGNYIYDETIAESFHDIYINGDNAADASKYVIEVLKKRLRG